MSFHVQILNQLIDNLSHVHSDEIVHLNNSLRLLSKWRSVLIQNTLLQQHGTIVLDGPFKGLSFLPQSAEGCHIPKLIGCYEQPLMPEIEKAIQLNYSLILNIGCAEGYYAVGMARRMLNTRVFAFDLNANARQVCAGLAKQNGVSDRVIINALFSSQDFEQFAGNNVLVLCDIEGGERELFNPELAPSLKGIDMIVESHECLIPGITKLLINRFSESHDILIIQDNGQRNLPNAPAWFSNLSHLDQLLAVWEWRSGPTPWLVMKAKERHSR